jgi:hypothetical protein
MREEAIRVKAMFGAMRSVACTVTKAVSGHVCAISHTDCHRSGR